jgi:hypothetical protein
VALILMVIIEGVGRFCLYHDSRTAYNEAFGV